MFVGRCHSGSRQTAAHQEGRGQPSGGQTHSVGGVDPQQVVGGHIQVMVAMGGGKHAHLFTERAGDTFTTAGRGDA